MSRIHGLTLIKDKELFTESVMLALHAGEHIGGECTFVIDELKRIYSSPSGGYWYEISPETRTVITKLFAEGGNHGLSVVWNDQRPAHVLPPALSESTAWAVTRLKHHRDRALAKEWSAGYTEERYLFKCELPDCEEFLIHT